MIATAGTVAFVPELPFLTLVLFAIDDSEMLSETRCFILGRRATLPVLFQTNEQTIKLS